MRSSGIDGGRPVRFNVRNWTEFKKLMEELEDDPLFARGCKTLARIDNIEEGMGYEVPNSMWITSAVDLGIIEIRRDSAPLEYREYIGGYEVIINEDRLKWVRAHAGRLEYGWMGEYECTGCGTIQDITYPTTKGKTTEPYWCCNPDCGRKKSFRLTSPGHLQRPIWRLPGMPKECTDSELVEQLMEFFRQHLVLKEHEYAILALWVMASWLVDDFRTCPYLAIIAPKSSGKTQVIEAIRLTAYRAYATTSITPAALFRGIEIWGLTLCIDEAQDLITSKTETGQAIYSCMLAGYKRGMPALRSGDSTTGFVPESFEVFGFKAFSGTKIVLPTLESRSITFNMRKAKPPKILMDEEWAMELRSLLLWYRFTHLRKLKLRMPDGCESGRIIELFTPLYTVESGLGFKDALDYTVRRMMERDIEEERSSTEAEIMRAIEHLIQTPIEGTFSGRTMVYIHEIVAALGWERNKSSSTIIGTKLKVMGIPAKHTNLGNGIEFTDPEVMSVIENLCKRYLNEW